MINYIKSSIDNSDLSDHKKPWLIESIKQFLNSDITHMTADQNNKIETVGCMIKLANLLNTEGVKVVNVFQPCFHYKIGDSYIHNENRVPTLYNSNDLYRDSDYSEHKTFAVETYRTSCRTSQHSYPVKFEYGTITEIHNSNSKLYKDIMIKGMALSINKKLLNANIFFIMQLGKIFETVDPFLNYLNQYNLETRVCFHY